MQAVMFTSRPSKFTFDFAAPPVLPQWFKYDSTSNPQNQLEETKASKNGLP